MEAQVALAFAAGLLSFATPCVLPLVPGYLSVVSGTAPGATGRRVVGATVAFIAGFTSVFALLGAAFAVCAAPCVGPVLATILALAGDTSTVAQGSILLLVYSLGLAVPFVLVGVGFARTM